MDVDDGGGKRLFVGIDVWLWFERVDESNCCRWSLNVKIFGCVNAHFSQRDVSQSRQYVNGGLFAKQQNDVDKRVDGEFSESWLWLLLPLRNEYMKSLFVESKGKLVDVNGENVWFKSLNGWKSVFDVERNGSNALIRRFVDENDDDVDDADDDGNEEKFDWKKDWFCCCCCCCCDGLLNIVCVGGKSGNLLLRFDDKYCWSTNSFVQFEHNFNNGFVVDDVIIVFGVSFKHDEHTAPVPLFILLVSFIIGLFQLVFYLFVRFS